MKRINLLLFLFLNFTVFAQNFTARIVDSQENPIPFATVQTGENSGVISNEEGYFTIFLEDLESKVLTISCMGFSPELLSVDAIEKNNNIVKLEEFVNELSQVYLSNSSPNADSIIVRVNKRLALNYSNENIKYNLFFRNTKYIDFGELEIKIKKATGLKKNQLEVANGELKNLTNGIMNNKTVHFKDYLADLYIQNQKKSKIQVHKATRLVDQKKNMTVDQIQEEAQHLILKYLDTTKTFKLKTGIIKIEDSLSIKSSNNKNKEPIHAYEVSNLRSESHELLHTSQIYDNTTLRTLLNSEIYKYSFVDFTFHNNEMIYVINFKPKRAKAKYVGTLYIADDSFAVIKADYAFAKGKRGEKLNLKLILGVKYVENVKRGTIIYKKNDIGIYQPQYIKEEYGNYFYVSRPIKFIENSSSRNKVAFNFLVEGNTRDKNEILFISNKSLSELDYESEIENKIVPYQNLKQYDASIWKKYNALEPLEEMKTFKVSN